MTAKWRADLGCIEAKIGWRKGYGLTVEHAAFAAAMASINEHYFQTFLA